VKEAQTALGLRGLTSDQIQPIIAASAAYAQAQQIGLPEAAKPDHIAERLIAKDFAKLYGDGKPREVGGRIPGAKDYWDNVQLDEHKAELEKNGKWKPAPPVVVSDPEVARAARERMAREMNQI
jgi:hypothetical protein